MRQRYEEPPPVAVPSPAIEPEPERYALVGPGEQASTGTGPSAETWHRLGTILCGMLETRRPGSRWVYYHDEALVPEGMTFFYAGQALGKLWGGTKDDPDPPVPPAYRRLTQAERDERDTVLGEALQRVDATLERSERFHAEGHEVAAVGLLKYVDLQLARFNFALARAQAGESEWQDVLKETERDREFEAWVSEQLATEGDSSSPA